MKQQIEEQLWSYIDGSANASEKLFVEKMLATDDVWKAKYKEQLELHHLLLHETELEQPSMRFTKNVMDGIAGMEPKAATRTYINKYIIRSIAAFFIITIGGLLIYSLAQVNWSASSGSSNIISFNTPELKIPQVDFSKLFSNRVLNIVLMTSIVLGLMVFDGILRRKKSAA
jgi:hypothetical protein